MAETVLGLSSVGQGMDAIWALVSLAAQMMRGAFFFESTHHLLESIHGFIGLIAQTG